MLLNIYFFFKKKTFNGSLTLSYLIDSSNLVTRKEIKSVTCWGDEAQSHNLIRMTEETGFNLYILKRKEEVFSQISCAARPPISTEFFNLMKVI